jgi:HemX protein
LNLLTDKGYFLIAVLIYGVSVVYSVRLWRKGFRRNDWVIYGLYWLAFLFHTGAMLTRGYSLSRCPIQNLAEAIAFIAWTIVASYLAIGLSARFRFLGAFASPVIFAIVLLALLPGFDKPPTDGAASDVKWASLHGALILLGYGAFGLSAVAGLMYLTQDHDLRINKMRAIQAIMPPVQMLEKVIQRMLEVGFVLWTAGLLLVPAMLSQNSTLNLKGDPKVIWSFFVWLGYLALMFVHWKFSPGGRRFAISSVACFAFVILTFWGVNLLSPVHNP